MTDQQRAETIHLHAETVHLHTATQKMQRMMWVISVVNIAAGAMGILVLAGTIAMSRRLGDTPKPPPASESQGWMTEQPAPMPNAGVPIGRETSMFYDVKWDPITRRLVHLPPPPPMEREPGAVPRGIRFKQINPSGTFYADEIMLRYRGSNVPLSGVVKLLGARKITLNKTD